MESMENDAVSSSPDPNACINCGRVSQVLSRSNLCAECREQCDALRSVSSLFFSE
ncbi:MAG TPA: hypothetical protein VMY77_15510 [Chitinophagaceae bacterium]|nr:hypothetical protein [Chitinophagaceae bacterium]